jgi:hypothetical protein
MILPRPSTWPVTKCPPNSPFARSGAFQIHERTGFEKLKIRPPPAFLQQVELNQLTFPRAEIFTAVRQQPFTARLPPGFKPRAQTPARTVSAMDFLRRARFFRPFRFLGQCL